MRLKVITTLKRVKWGFILGNKKDNQTKSIQVSIILVSYNNFHLLKACLDSLYKFTHNLIFEVIIVDNCSTEKNIESLIYGLPNVTLIKNDSNRGFGSANNQGISVARGTYILLLNNDTILTENSIYEVYRFADNLGEDAIIGCRILNPDGTLQHSVYDFPSVWNVFTSNFFLYQLNKKSKFLSKYHLMNKAINIITEVDVVTGAFVFVNTEGIKRIQGFDERFYFYNEETDLCFRFKKNGGKIYYFPRTSIIHIKGGTSGSNLWFKFKNQSISQIKYFQKHFRGIKFLSLLLFHYTGIFIRIPVFLLSGIFTLNNYLIKRGLYFARLLFLYPKNSFKWKLNCNESKKNSDAFTDTFPT